MRVEDMLDVEYDGYIYQRRGDESVFLGQYDLSQRTRMDDKTGYDMPRLEYTIIFIKMPFLYDICKEQLIADKDETNDRSVPEGYKRFYVEQDPTPWKAQEVYQLTYQDTGTRENYLLCYKDRIIEINFDWEPTEEHMNLVAERLGGVSP